MKKTFPLHIEGKDDKRIVELIRNEVGKYVNREKRKKLPAEHDQWEFACRVGSDRETSESVELKHLPGAIDAVAASEAPDVYVEVISSPRPRAKAAPKPADTVL